MPRHGRDRVPRLCFPNTWHGYTQSTLGPKCAIPGAKLSILSKLVDLVSDADVPGPQEMDVWLAREARAPETQEGHSPRTCPWLRLSLAPSLG